MVDKNHVKYGIACVGAGAVTLAAVFVVAIAVFILMVFAQAREFMRALAAGSWSPRDVVDEVLIDGFRNQTTSLFNIWHSNIYYVLNKIFS